MQIESQEGVTAKPRDAEGREERFTKVSVATGSEVWGSGSKCRDGVKTNGTANGSKGSGGLGYGTGARAGWGWRGESPPVTRGNA